MCSDQTRMCSDQTRMCSDQTRMCLDQTRMCSDQTKMCSDQTRMFKLLVYYMFKHFFVQMNFTPPSFLRANVINQCFSFRRKLYCHFIHNKGDIISSGRIISLLITNSEVYLTSSDMSCQFEPPHEKNQQWGF